MRLRTVLVGMLCCAIAEASWADAREHMERVANVIEEHYFDVTRAREIADGLRRSAREGEHDSLQDPRDLARALTRRLVQFDAHFHVSWTTPRPDALSRDANNLPRIGTPDESEIERRHGYGFRRVEVLPGAVGYLDLRSFAHFEFDERDAPARRAADAALRLIADADAVIIDLRDNGGGSPAMVGYLVSAFTSSDANIYNVFHSRDRVESERPKVPYPHPNVRVPLYILISGRTGSAAEAFTYTLQAAKRALVIGQQSAGAANPGDSFPAGEGFSVFVATGTPRNPITGSNWEGAGVRPDVTVASEDAVQRAHRLALEAVISKMPNRRPAVDTAWTLEALSASPGSTISINPTDYTGTYGDAAVTIEDEGLTLQRGRRPAWTLIPLGGDLFYPNGEPARRVRFARDSTDRVVQVELLYAEGFGSVMQRSSGGSP